MSTATKLTTADVEAAIGPLSGWAHQCHGASYQLLKSGLVKGRVARGWCRGVMGQHSWVVEGMDCYDPEAPIIDPTLWSYDSSVEGLWTGTGRSGLHEPHGGYGTIWKAYKPSSHGGQVIELDPEEREALPIPAKIFLDMVGPLDRAGWNELFEAPPNGGWGAGAIILAAHRTPKLTALVPIDRLGMLTDVNPGNCYLV